MIDPVMQGAIDAIEMKFSDINKEIQEEIVTISINGPSTRNNKYLFGKILKITTPEFVIVELNSEQHFIRYKRVKEI